MFSMMEEWSREDKDKMTEAVWNGFFFRPRSSFDQCLCVCFTSREQTRVVLTICFQLSLVWRFFSALLVLSLSLSLLLSWIRMGERTVLKQTQRQGTQFAWGVTSSCHLVFLSFCHQVNAFALFLKRLKIYYLIFIVVVLVTSP